MSNKHSTSVPLILPFKYTEMPIIQIITASKVYNKLFPSKEGNIPCCTTSYHVEDKTIVMTCQTYGITDDLIAGILVISIDPIGQILPIFKEYPMTKYPIVPLPVYSGIEYMKDINVDKYLKQLKTVITKAGIEYKYYNLNKGEF